MHPEPRGGSRPAHRCAPTSLCAKGRVVEQRACQEEKQSLPGIIAVGLEARQGARRDSSQLLPRCRLAYCPGSRYDKYCPPPFHPPFISHSLPLLSLLLSPLESYPWRGVALPRLSVDRHFENKTNLKRTSVHATTELWGHLGMSQRREAASKRLIAALKEENEQLIGALGQAAAKGMPPASRYSSGTIPISSMRATRPVWDGEGSSLALYVG